MSITFPTTERIRWIVGILFIALATVLTAATPAAARRTSAAATASC